MGDPICATSASSYMSTVVTPRWYRLDRAGVVRVGGARWYSVTAALRLATYLGARHIWLAGHDCVPGPDICGHPWEDDALKRMAQHVDEIVTRMRRELGIMVHRVQGARGQVTVDGVRC